MPIRSIGTPAYERENREERRPYFPFLAAVGAGILLDPEELAQPIEHAPAVDFAQATLPNCKQAGLVAVGKISVVAFDLVAAEFRDGNIYVWPASKNALYKGKIQEDEQGLILAQRDNGLVSVAGVVVNSERYRPLIDRMKSDGRVVASIGKSSLFLGNSLSWPRFEVQDVDSKTGNEKLVPYRQIYSF